MKFTGLKLAAVAGLIACAGSAFAGELVVAEYEINDHPQGGFAPPVYALRLDNVLGFELASFSADVFNDATLTVIQDSNTNDLYIDIAGTFHGGEEVGDAWATTFDISASFRYSANVVATANGWAVDGFSLLNNGTITRLDTNETTTWYGMEDALGDNGPAGNAFTFAADGFRIDNDDSTWVGRGWLTQNDDGSMTAPPAQDWIFTANLIPAPSAMALFGFAGIATMRRRR
jgi:CubicO group peptidase (beta-lactamase class C family)